MFRYVRAFVIALKMTLKGEQPAAHPYAPLLQWMDRTPGLVADVYKAAERDGFDRETRDQLTLKLDGRGVSMQTVLEAVEYHARQEYPYLLRNLTSHSLTAIYAGNMNDQYNIMRLRDVEDLKETTTRQAVTRLSEHLDTIPASNDLPQPEELDGQSTEPERL
jgi:hypothetical protein